MTWLGVERHVNSVGLRSAESDPVVRWLLRYIRDGPCPIYQDVVLLVSWDSLIQLHKTLRWLDQDTEALWSNLTWSFIETVSRINPIARENRLGQKLLNDTQYHTRRWYRVDRAKHPQLALDDSDDDPTGEIPSHYLDQAVTERSIDHRWAVKRLRSLVRNGPLTRPDYQILLGSHIYGRSLEEMAVHLGVPYGVAKKRRQRAVKKLQKSAPHLSPSNPDSPLYPVERVTRKEADDARELSQSGNHE